jgi:hypothetical protein
MSRWGESATPILFSSWQVAALARQRLAHLLHGRAAWAARSSASGAGPR